MISACIWNNGFIMSEDLLPGGEIETLSCPPPKVIIRPLHNCRRILHYVP